MTGCPFRFLYYLYFCTMNEKTIKRRDALRIMELTENGKGKAFGFSIEWYMKNGEVRYLSRARCCGTKQDINQKNARVRNIVEIDKEGFQIGRPTLVSIDRLRRLNGSRITY